MATEQEKGQLNESLHYFFLDDINVIHDFEKTKGESLIDRKKQEVKKEEQPIHDDITNLSEAIVGSAVLELPGATSDHDYVHVMGNMISHLYRSKDMTNDVDKLRKLADEEGYSEALKQILQKARKESLTQLVVKERGALKLRRLANSMGIAVPNDNPSYQFGNITEEQAEVISAPLDPVLAILLPEKPAEPNKPPDDASEQDTEEYQIKKRTYDIEDEAYETGKSVIERAIPVALYLNHLFPEKDKVSEKFGVTREQVLEKLGSDKETPIIKSVEQLTKYLQKLETTNPEDLENFRNQILGVSNISAEK